MVSRIATMVACLAAFTAATYSTANAADGGGHRLSQTTKHVYGSGHGDYRGHQNRHGWRFARNDGRHRFGRGHGGSSGTTAISNGNVIHIPGIGTYAGSIDVVGSPRSGLMFTTAIPAGDPVVSYREPKMKIIDVKAQPKDYGCSMEAGVCVIRGL
ncbi:hypothetical protein [Rhizobium halophytocola]|uniref:Uncharacterized protein n=1 Tax=Rhizobium halophytocola TaxID=735519 RepID=A0ABS4E2U8_9HYPH|nr:hypothetical protein [Rhizobium halophytocola]MBP1852258.1 hypothetical protein [Rhizobium halophytocola]